MSYHRKMETPKHHKLIYASSPDRGLDILLKMWPEVKAKYPEATLDIAYGWKLFDEFFINNPEKMAWKQTLLDIIASDPSITDHGRLGKEDLKKLRQSCGIWAYPTYFTEINCITALEMQRDGCVPVTMSLAALKETVGAGLKLDGDISDPEIQKLYLNNLLTLMGDEEVWKDQQERGIKFAEDYDWSKIAIDWSTQFEPKPQDILVSILTSTNRRGWWNIMANNIANQTYKNVEWLIIDDYPENREEIAKEYAKKYKIKIRYYRSKPHKVQRNYGLVNADNTGVQFASGALLVFLQDFILMPETGIEELVLIHKASPNCLIAPTDEYFEPKVKPDTQSEDWFHGELDVKGKFMRSNVRNQNLGVRQSNNPFEFEMNYGAIPTHIARDLGGFYEFFDFGLGFNNTEIAFRALKKGAGLLVDDTNIATCIDHWNALEGTPEHGLKRERRLNDPQYFWMLDMIIDGKLPLKRAQELDDKLDLTYEMPEDLPKGDEVKWVNANLEKIVAGWKEKVTW